VPVNPDEQAATSLPRRQRDAVCRPQLGRTAARPRLRTESASADRQLHLDATAADRATRHRISHHSGVRQALDVACPQSVDRSLRSAAAVTSHVHSRHLAEVSNVVRRLLLGDLDALSRSEQIHRRRRHRTIDIRKPTAAYVSVHTQRYFAVRSTVLVAQIAIIAESR